MSDAMRPDPAQLVAMRQHILALKRDAVIDATRHYYTRLLAEGDTAAVREAWRPVRYALEDWLTQARAWGMEAE